MILEKLKSELIILNYVDTIHWKKSPLIVCKLLYYLFCVDFKSIIISASSVSTYRLLKFINFTNPKILPKISYFVIGGYFPSAIENDTFNVQYYQNLKSIIVEGNNLKIKLARKLHQVPLYVIPNFKKIPFIRDLEVSNNSLFKFVFVGRISEAKGVGLIIDASILINKHFPNLTFTVDFFGPLQEDFNFNHICRYHGYLDFSLHGENSYHKLKSYNCFLFPTTWIGEGFPGVVIDAYAAGLPVIATDWNMNKEIIKEGENGFIIPPNDVQSLANKMIWVMGNIETCRKIGLNNLEESKKYHINNVWELVFPLF